MNMNSISMADLLWKKLPLFDNVYLSMQGQNIMLVDFYLRDLEEQLRGELYRQERTPMPDTVFVSALSQMWIFAVYELLRTWRQLVRELRGASNLTPKEPGASNQPSYAHLAEEYFRKQTDRLQSDPTFGLTLEQAKAEVEPLFRRIEALRMNLAKHEVPKSKGQRAIAPGYGRIDESDGSISWFVDLGDVTIDGKTYRGQDMVSRRGLGNSLRLVAIGHPLQADEEDDEAASNPQE